MRAELCSNTRYGYSAIRSACISLTVTRPTLRDLPSTTEHHPKTGNAYRVTVAATDTVTGGRIGKGDQQDAGTLKRTVMVRCQSSWSRTL